MSPLTLTTAICTHNPNLDILRKAINSISDQVDLPSDFELLIVDNCSKESIPKTIIPDNLKSRFRIVIEANLGISHARLRAFKEAKSELLLFVDDDNILAKNYIRESLEIAKEFPHLGAWGAGIIEPIYEQTPSPDLLPYVHMLAIFKTNTPMWSNLPWSSISMPVTAGMMIREICWLKHISNIEENPKSLLLGEKGGDLMRAEDTDIALSVIDSGYGHGTFPSLSILHYIPKERVTTQYLSRLKEGSTYSKLLLKHLRGIQTNAKMPPIQRVKFWLKYLKSSPIEKKLRIATRSGYAKYSTFLSNN